ncbi:MAG: DUF2764 family protein [Lentisphaerae bacterium]|nr:DUF2764 family protein [Lentisphaerota bacterium]
MPSDFFYFLSSLPLLRWGEKPFCSYSEFLTYAQSLLTDAETALLANLSLCPSETSSATLPVVRAWEDWETFMRNALVSLRCQGDQAKADKWLRQERTGFADMLRHLEEIMALPNAWAREQALDRLRWQKLDELEDGHYYNFTAVVIYAYRLLLLNRQASWDDDQGGRVFAALLEKTAAAADSCRSNEESIDKG